MVFSSIIFLFGFLPLVVVVYFAINLKLRNFWILLVSIFFIGGEKVHFFWVILFSAIINYVFALILSNGWRVWEKPDILKTKNNHHHVILVISIICNLGILIYFKYTNWIVAGIGELFSKNLNSNIILPLGISFFTFQGMSYVIDVYRGEVEATRDFIDYAAFFSMFPQLVAGPIVRYSQVSEELKSRDITLNKFTLGIKRFIIGLSKKVIVANTVAVVADSVFALPANELTTSLSWLGIIAYTIQIYFDFSGYSDMAIGMGLMFGFHFPENFRHPYASQNIREFWQRWHISLSSWFRDYLYFPLGGSKGTFFKTSRNLMIIFLLCGLWHGASWSFVVWGVWHGMFLMLERVKFFKLFLQLLPRPFKHIYLLIIVMGGWILFRADTLTYAVEYFKACVGFADGNGYLLPVGQIMTPYVWIITIVGVIGGFPVINYIDNKTKLITNSMSAQLIRISGSLMLLFLLLSSIAELFASSYNPFIYFRF